MSDFHSGFVSLLISYTNRFDGVDQTFVSIVNFQPTLPHGVTFVILGQHVS